MPKTGDEDYNPLNDLDYKEELRKMALTDREIFALFVMAGSLAMGIHLAFDPDVDFDKEADGKIKRMGREALIHSTINVKDELGGLLTKILERYEAKEQAETDNAFADLINNLKDEN
jgi:hypothetical protein